jgi:hypothetical protein
MISWKASMFVTPFGAVVALTPARHVALEQPRGLKALHHPALPEGEAGIHGLAKKDRWNADQKSLGRYECRLGSNNQGRLPLSPMA